MLFFMDREDEYFVLGLVCPVTKCRQLSNTKETNKALSALLSYIRTQEFLRTREKLEPQANASRTSGVFIKIRKCLYNSTMHEEQVL